MSGTAFPYRGRALMKYRPPPQPGQSAEQAAQQFAFAKGDTITVTGQADDEGDWLQGEKDGVEGVFPAGFVEKIEEEEEPVIAAATAAEPKDDKTAATPAPQGKSPEDTVQATPSNPVNVTEAHDSTRPAEVQTSLREPEAPVEEPTLADVTPAPDATIENKLTQPAQATANEPKTDAALTSPVSAPAAEDSSATTAAPKAAPPSPAKKPNALASRIAAFQAAAASQAAEPPVPKPKPKQWTRPAAPPAQAISPTAASDSPRSPGLASPPATASAPAPLAAEGVQTEASGERRDFSAQDAQASISRGGGSLRDRIKALQGGGAGGMGAQVDPAAKPWKKQASNDDVETTPASASTDAYSVQPENPEDNLREAVVLDSPPAVEHRTAEEPQSDIPGFEPAEEDEPAGETAGAAAAKSTVGEEAVAEPYKDFDDSVSAISPRSAELATSNSVTGANEVSPATETVSSSDVGVQRLGVPMPALPKRAAGPRARKAKSPAPTSPAATDRTEESTMPSSAPSEAPVPASAQASVAPTAVETAGSNDILASMGGANKLLADDDDDEDSRPKAPVHDDDDFDTPTAPPPVPSMRPPVPKTERSFEDPELEHGEEELPVEQYISREEEVPRHTIAEEAVEALPSTEEPAVAAGDEPMSPSRPPLPPPFIRQQTQPEEREAEEEPAPPMPPARHPPIPTHPPPGETDLMTTAAEDAFLDKQPDVVTPPEEAADESTVSPAANAPAIAEIMQGRHEAGAHPAEMAQPTFGKMEGTATPAVEQAPPMFAAAQAQQASEKGEAEGDEDDEEEEEEEEDPEVARRRALAARMAKLGGRGPLMGGPMLGLGGFPPKKPTKKKSVSAESTEPVPQASLARLDSQAIEPESGSGHSTPGHPQRRVGGPPLGGFALPGIVPSRPKEAESEPVEEANPLPKEPEELDLNDKIALSGDELARRSAAATDQAFALTDAQREAEAQQAPPTDATAEEEEAVPPPRPATGPPSRSVPPPIEMQEDAGEAEELAQGTTFAHEQEDHFDEPESYAAANEPDTVEDDEMPPPPPPPRPTGGHQASLPPPSRPAPGSPLPSATPSSPGFSGLDRSATMSSRRSTSTYSSGGGGGAAISPRQSVDAQFAPARMQGGAAVGGAFLARDIDLDTAQPWWRSQGAVPRSIQGRYDVFVDLSESSSTKRGKTTVEKEIEVIYPDYSKTLVSVSFVGDDTAESATSISQTHYPPSIKPNLDALLQWSASLGAQVFAAAHTKMGDKSARGQSDADLIRFCYGRATDPLLPIGSTFGVKVYEAVVEQGKKAPMVGEDDEPRAGDIVAISAKFKHNLSSKTVGSEANGPHIAVVAGWEAKKGKLKVIEVETKNGTVDENTYRVDEMRAGSLVVYRVAPRDFIV